MNIFIADLRILVDSKIYLPVLKTVLNVIFQVPSKSIFHRQSLLKLIKFGESFLFQTNF
jgi:hypothetical protein